ncbi:hypothetical protein M433DRAFT_489689 [Acidomyces richmondensis BFW]|nr:MAG: hypothetical protein FE78DRAFT_288912 [Acidomyces sp. 'richmondensis']KYG47545.1 hypothetical protein M433DRAFT_489689 [Acidomyces richmondensis BFW]
MPRSYPGSMIPRRPSQACLSRTRQAAYSHARTPHTHAHTHTHPNFLHPRVNATPSTPSVCMRASRAVGHWLRLAGSAESCVPWRTISRASILRNLPSVHASVQVIRGHLRGVFGTMSCASDVSRRTARPHPPISPSPAHHQHNGPHVHAERVCWAALPRASSVSLTNMSCSLTVVSFGGTADLMTRIVSIVCICTACLSCPIRRRLCAYDLPRCPRESRSSDVMVWPLGRLSIPSAACMLAENGR